MALSKRRSDIEKILIIGSGPIVIGQACEFDYSGTQACKALKKLGYSVVLVNSNPATIMTDPQTADITYIEPLNAEYLEKIIKKERPDALLPNLGGQTALNLCLELSEKGILNQYGVEVLGVDMQAIRRGEDRQEFKKSMSEIGIETARSSVANSAQEALNIASELGFPVVVRPCFTMGGEGGGIARDAEELSQICARGLSASATHQVLIEESVLGWQELELEVVRDSKNDKITVCFIENVDPMGVHTGDSLCTAPMLTVSQNVQKRLQDQAYKIIEKVGVIGGANVQFAYDKITDRIIVIEINPRTSRSSALASKATGFPIAYISALLALGINLSDVECGRFGTLDKYVPTGDMIVVKFARWAFEKFKGTKDVLGTQMKAVGEVMSIAKNYKEALQKAVRGLEIGAAGLGFYKDYNRKSKEELLGLLKAPSSDRQFIIYEALRKGASISEIEKLTRIDEYFLSQMQELVNQEEHLISRRGQTLSLEDLKSAKENGFSDKYLSGLLHVDENQIRKMRDEYGICAGFEAIHVSGTKDSAYYFSSYNLAPAKQSNQTGNGKGSIMILGGGPNRIGQGIEFDYACVHAAKRLKELGFRTIVVNCNPETISTDYDTSDMLYFEPLTLEDIINIYKVEKPLGCVVQFGGQTPLNLAKALEENGVNILGTSPKVIEEAEDRDIFEKMMQALDIPMPESMMAGNLDEALDASRKVGYPVMVRPSFVLGGSGMRIIHSDDDMRDYINVLSSGVSKEHPVLVDRFLNNATECEADAICDGSNAFVPSIMQHIELAGIHSGDSACVIPPISLSRESMDTIKAYTQKIAKEMGVQGLINVQYAIENGKVYVIEANPRCSRTVPLVSKVCNIQMVRVATDIITSRFTNAPSPIMQLKERKFPHFGVKEAVLPFNMLNDADPVLGPEMHSTGEVLGLGESFEESFYKAEEASGVKFPLNGNIFASLCDSDKAAGVEIIRSFAEIGFKIFATSGTFDVLRKSGVDVVEIGKISSDPSAIPGLINGKEPLIIINTPSGSKTAMSDGSAIRKLAIKTRTPYITTLAAAKAVLMGIRKKSVQSVEEIRSLQEYHSGIAEL